MSNAEESVVSPAPWPYDRTTMHRIALSSVLVSLLIPACGGKVVVDAEPMGGAGGSIAGMSGAGGSSTSCSGWFFDLVVDGATSSLTSSCSYAAPLAPTPFGVMRLDGVLLFEACASDSASSQGVSGFIDAKGGVNGPGTYTLGGLEYTGTDGLASGDASGGFQVIITQLGPVGGLIDGSLQMTVLENGATHMVQGTFALCRVPDQ